MGLTVVKDKMSCTYTHSHACIPTYTHIYTHLDAYIHACIHTYVLTYIPIYIHAYIHTYTGIQAGDEIVIEEGVTLTCAHADETIEERSEAFRVRFVLCGSNISPCMTQVSCNAAVWLTCNTCNEAQQHIRNTCNAAQEHIRNTCIAVFDSYAIHVPQHSDACACVNAVL
jgi:hypothetical protein